MDRITEEALCEVQAQLYALRIAVRAIARTHPAPVALLEAWRDALKEAATCSPVAPGGWRNSDYLTERMQACAEDWTAELVELAVPSPDPSVGIWASTAAGESEDTGPQSRSHQDCTGIDRDPSDRTGPYHP